MSSTLMRQWQMLRLIPRHPSKVATSDLMQSLADSGFKVTHRTLQRDLIKLSEIYPLRCDNKSKPFGWSWHAGAVMDIPGMDSHTALAYWLADQHLRPLLPKSTLTKLQAHFDAATKVLNSIPTNKGTPAWRNKVRVLHRGPNLKSPAIDEDVQNHVYDALLRHRKLRMTYQARGKAEKEYELNPLGLILKDGISYLVCTIWDYKDIRLLTLHRIKQANMMKNTPATVPKGFDLDDYIASGKLDFVIKDRVALKARFSTSTAFHLEERPLSDDQVLTPFDDDNMLLTATVQDTNELRWWLLGFGDQVEVLEPEDMRKDMKQILQSAANQY